MANHAHHDELAAVDKTSFAIDWLDNHTTRQMASEALTFISESAQHGLDPESYQYTELNRLFSTASPSQREPFNSLLTQNLIALMQDVKLGHWDPELVDPDWFIEQDHFDANAFLQHAVDSGHLTNHLHLLFPQQSEYTRLISVLARYQSYADAGGWKKIPAMPKLSPGEQHPNLMLIQQRLAAEDDFFAQTHAVPSDYYDDLMVQAVERFQRRYRLKVDGIIGRRTLRAMNVPVEDRIAQIKINLERYRWLPDSYGPRYILVNLANFRLRAVDQGQTQLDMNVVVGKKERQTPSFSAQMSHMVFNPYWHVPGKLARLDLLPKQQQDPNYFFNQSIRVFTGVGQGKVELNPYQIDWQSHDPETPLPYIFRQDPGKQNALGQLKFMFKNPWAIYLHDSPSKSLFNKPNRALSSGCIRVADPVGLAEFSLAQATPRSNIIERIESERNQGLVLKQPVSIFAAYFTVSFQGDDVLFLPDVYRRDKRMIKNLY